MNDATTILSETTISLLQAARKLPPSRRGAPVSLACVLRWVLAGARAPDGTRVRLEAVRLGGRWLTSLEALGRFADRLTPQPAIETSTPIPTPKKRRAAAEAAEQELGRLGI